MKKARRTSPQTRWTRDPENEKYWVQQLALWQDSGSSVRAFCKEHGVVETSFYAWRRELIIRDRESRPAEVVEEHEQKTNKFIDSRGSSNTDLTIQAISWEPAK